MRDSSSAERDLSEREREWRVTRRDSIEFQKRLNVMYVLYTDVACSTLFIMFIHAVCHMHVVLFVCSNPLSSFESSSFLLGLILIYTVRLTSSKRTGSSMNTLKGSGWFPPLRGSVHNPNFAVERHVAWESNLPCQPSWQDYTCYTSSLFNQWLGRTVS